MPRSCGTDGCDAMSTIISVFILTQAPLCIVTLQHCSGCCGNAKGESRWSETFTGSVCKCCTGCMLGSTCFSVLWSLQREKIHSLYQCSLGVGVRTSEKITYKELCGIVRTQISRDKMWMVNVTPFILNFISQVFIWIVLVDQTFHISQL